MTINIPPLSSVVSSGSATHNAKQRERRGRSGSLVEMKEVGNDEQDVLDQSVYRNNNPEWVNAKGAYLPLEPASS